MDRPHTININRIFGTLCPERVSVKEVVYSTTMLTRLDPQAILEQHCQDKTFIRSLSQSLVLLVICVLGDVLEFAFWAWSIRACDFGLYFALAGCELWRRRFKSTAHQPKRKSKSDAKRNPLFML